MIVSAAFYEGHDALNQWSFVLTHFAVSPGQFYWRAAPEDVGRVVSHYKQRVGSVAELPPGPLVLVQGPSGRYLQGEAPLAPFDHPPDAVYVFGHDHENLTSADLGGRDVAASVYVETAGHAEMYSWVAAAVVLHDRLVKMANQITDGRTNVNTMETSNLDDLAGSGAGTLDSEIFYQGSNSIGYYTTTTRDGLLHDFGSATDLSDNTFYILVNCGIVGLLETKANAGFTVRFCGATVTDWFEVYVAGSDDWPTAFSGGWVQFAVDIEEAHTLATGATGGTNGTKPATNAIRYVGVSSITSATMPRMADNTWIDQIARLPAGSPGIIIEGRNGGSTDWDWDDVIAQADTGKWGTCRPGPGGSVVLNTPVQFGADDTSTHAFTDTNRVILWDDQEFLPDGFYGFSGVGNSGGTTDVNAGIKTGTGDDATGAQGWVVSSAATGPRWFMDFDDPDLDSVNFYGCQLQHGGDFQLDDAAVEVISSSFVDCSSLVITGITEFLRNAVIDADTADGVAFLTTDDLTDVVFCTFEFSDGHAIELTTPRVATQASKGNQFVGYGAIASNDAAIYNNTAGAVQINISNGGSTPTYRNGASASTDPQNTVTHSLTGIQQNSEVTYVRQSDSAVVFHVENVGAGGETDYAYNYVSDVDVDIFIHHLSYKWQSIDDVTLGNTDASIPVQQIADAVYLNP